MLAQTCKRLTNVAVWVSTMLVAFGVLVSTCVFGQVPAANRSSRLPEFEVASVRPSGPDQREVNGFYTYDGGRIVGHGCTIEYLVMIAYNVQLFQISGAPGWAKKMSDERFELEAKPPESSRSSHWETGSPKNYPGEEERQMLQSLLAERFKLQVHREVRQGPVLILRLGAERKKLKLTPSKDKTEFPWAGGMGGLPGGDGLRGMNISMAEFAVRLSSWLERHVIDETGLQGSFDFEFRTGEREADSNADVNSSILMSLKGIGLKLSPAKGPVEAIVIDHVERPSEN